MHRSGRTSGRAPCHRLRSILTLIAGQFQNVHGMPIMGAWAVRSIVTHLWSVCRKVTLSVDSTDKWTAFFDPLLCALNIVDDGQYFYQAGGGGVEAAKAADDLVSFAGTHAALQAKADLVAAICLIFGLKVGAHKLRCFHLTWGNPNRPATTHILIHLAGWTLREVPLRHDGLMKHLEVRWVMNVNNDMQEVLATTRLSVARMTSMPCTMDLKRGELNSLIFQSLSTYALQLGR